jgi:selenocysteine-specific elongation factor
VRLADLPDGFTVAQFRDATGITRRHAVPLLEWLDTEGVTRREGDGRALRRSPPAGPASDGARSR